MEKYDLRTRYDRFMEAWNKNQREKFSLGSPRETSPVKELEKKLSDENLTKKEKRIIGRRLRFIQAMKAGVAYCTLHKNKINEETYCEKRCHLGNHGNGYCQHLARNFNDWPKPKKY